MNKNELRLLKQSKMIKLPENSLLILLPSQNKQAIIKENDI